MDINTAILSGISVISIFIGLPSIFGYFRYLGKKQKNELEKMYLQREMLELEIQRDETRIRALELENRSLDKRILE